MNFFTLVTLLLLINNAAQAFENVFFLKAGLNSSVSRIGVFEKDPDDDEDEREIQGKNFFGGYGFNTHFGYRWKNFELTASSGITFGKVDNLAFVINENSFEGSGNYQNLVVSPNMRYFVPWPLLKGWRISGAVGPVWSQQTVRLKEFTSSGGYAGKQFKLTYDSIGYALALGIEEDIKFKNLHPVYFEISYMRLYSIKSYLVDTTDSTKTNILSTSEAKNDIGAEAIVFTMGIVLF